MQEYITLIHGTFAKDAAWTQADSSFREKLSLCLTEKPVYEIFGWSAINSHRARIEAGQLLAAQLKAQIENFPLHPKTIIAHSHGGNVALYALKILGDDAKQFKLVTLATPFLNSKKREFESKAVIYSEMLVLLFTIVRAWLMMCIIIYVWHFFQPFDKDHAPYRLVYPLMLVPPLSLLYSWKLKENFKKQAEELPNEIKVILDKVSLESMADTKMLAIVDHNDEVKRYFNFLAPLWEYILRFHNLLLYLVGKFLYVGGVAILGVIILSEIYGKHLPTGPNRLFDILLIIIGIALLAFLAMPLLGMSISTLFYLIKSNVLFLGVESQEHQLLIQTTPSNMPFGFKNLQVFELQSRRRGMALKHGVYEEDEAVTAIAEWIHKSIHKLSAFNRSPYFI